MISDIIQVIACLHNVNSSYVKLKVLDAAALAHPNCWRQIKMDGVDLVVGLGELLRLQWSGDVNLNDRELQK